jgi:hypothetical protein
MHTAVRSPLVAAATLVGAGAIAVSPVVPAMPDVSAQVRLSVMTRPAMLENPFDTFGPVVESALLGSRALIGDIISSPTPSLQSVLLNQNAHAFALAIGGVNAGVSLSDAAWATPAAIVVATQQVAQGDTQGALATLHDGIVVPLGVAVNDIVEPVQNILQNQLNVAQRLATAVPEAAMGVVMATISSFQQVTAAAVDAGTAVVDAAGKLNPIAVANAITQGAANVAQVFVSTTIGNAEIVNSGATEIKRQSSNSIAQAFISGRQNIADAILPQRRIVAAAVAPLAVTTAAAVPAITGPAKSTGAGAAVKTVKTVKTSTTQATKAAGEKKRTTGKSAK